MLGEDHREAIRLGGQALAIAESFGLDELRAHALNSIGSAKFHFRDPTGLEDLEASAAIGRAIRSPEAARALNNIGALLWAVGDTARARDAIDEAVRLATEYGHAPIARVARGQQIVMLADQGDWEAGLRAADEFISPEAHHAIDDSVLRRRARIRLGRGDVAGALGDANTAVELARTQGDPQGLVPSLACAVRVHAEAGLTREAQSLSDELIAAFPNPGEDWMLSDFAWAAVSVDRKKELSNLLERAPEVSPYGHAARALLDGDYATAAEIFQTIGERENAAHAQRYTAARLIADGRPEAAEPLLEDATQFFRSVRASRYLNEIDELLRTRASAS
jgi:tetratricopeptide (TPR) repeat protein